MAEREGWEVVAEFSDEAFSAYSGNRGPGLAQARATAALHAPAVLLVQHSDRLARGAGDAPGAAEHLAEILFGLAGIPSNCDLSRMTSRSRIPCSRSRWASAITRTVGVSHSRFGPVCNAGRSGVRRSVRSRWGTRWTSRSWMGRALRGVSWIQPAPSSMPRSWIWPRRASRPVTSLAP